MNRHNRSDKPDWVPPRSAKLLDQVRERVRYLNYSLQTEKACVYWVKALAPWACAVVTKPDPGLCEAMCRKEKRARSA